MMTIDEAIAHAREVEENVKYNANTFTESDLLDENCRKAKAECLECASEHKQLVSWLEELKQRREADRWISVEERLPEGNINPNTTDFEEVLCTTTFGDVRVFKYGKPLGHEKAHFWHGCGIFDCDVVAWRPLPEPYKENGGKT